ncbi:glycosyltransferase [Chryseobacterium sp. RLHN22]|uniref:glycosyltransferase n=1 Tax=Chryseobacterium sp. RLHN22 TaxID=3437885 RepID=UPI003D9AE130
MKILIDNSNLNVGGGIQVATSFLEDLKTLDLQNQLDGFSDIYVIQSANSSKQIQKNTFGKKFKFYDLYTDSEKSIYKRRKIVKNIEDEVKPEIIFTVFGPSYHRSAVPKIVGFAIPHLIYTDSPYFDSLSLLSRIKTYFTYTIKNYCFLKNSNVLIFESEKANQIYTSKNKIKSYTVNNTLNSVFENREIWENINIKKSNFDILCLSANYPHKNLKVIPQIIDYILETNKLTDFKFHISGVKESFGFSEKHNKFINYLGHVKLEMLPSLYSHMDCLFMPTLLEVFSTTYLEAMFMKVPILSSDMEFARDICGNAAIFCNPTDVEEYAKNILILYNDPTLRKNLIQKGEQNLKRFGNSLQRTKQYIEIIKNTKNANKG